MATIEKVRKRDGRLESFDVNKIATAISKAFVATGEHDGEVAKKLALKVASEVEKRFVKEVPGVEDIQDVVEEELIKAGYAKVAKAYILYRQKRAEVRGIKSVYGVKDDLKLSLNAVRVLERRYLLKDGEGRVVETTSQMFWRVARTIAGAERLYGASMDEATKLEVEFYRMMAGLEFLPNSPTLMNAGTNVGQLSACFVLPVEDSIEDIFNSLKLMAIIHKSGGGTGFSFSRLRPRGDVVASTMGVASGPVSFMKIYDVATEVIKQGGKRRGANMGVLRANHPDILEFINAKTSPGLFENFNLSVAVDDAFMEAVESGSQYPLINPRTKEVVKKLNARDVFDLIATSAWRTGDPGLIFIDEINRHNPTPKLGEIEATNPCGEVPLLPYESCNLGSINLSKTVEKGEINWDKLEYLVRKAARFLDNVIDVNRYPIDEIERMTKLNRKIGLGIMGLAEMFIQLELPYTSKEALKIAEEVMKFISEKARETSVELGRLKGSFPSFEESIWSSKYDAMRNAALTSIAPTGTIGIIANTSSGIEPLFAIAYVRQVMEGVRLIEVNSLFEKVARERGFYSQELMLKVAKEGTVENVPEVPKDVKELFATALDIDPEWHVRMQAAFQKCVDNAVAKTINLRPEASIEDVRKSFMLAYKLKCKGVTVFRYGSKPAQVLYLGLGVRAEEEPSLSCPSSICAI